MSNIKGFQRVSLIDYPDNIAAIIFLGGCNFRCLYCHNPELVLTPAKISSIDKKEVFDYLLKRKKMLDGVVITGGEPCLTPDLIDLIKQIKAIGLKVKLDTNGTMPHRLEEALPLVDYVAMDIKSSIQGYEKVIGVKTNIENIKKSVELIRSKAKDYEFRTTLVRNLITKEDIKEICSWLKGSKKYSLQQFNKNCPIIDGKLRLNNLFLPEELEGFRNYCKDYFETVEIRGL